MSKYICLGVTDDKKHIETIMQLEIEEYNREEVEEVIKDALDLIYDGTGDEAYAD